ncbi:EAL domain-containing protein [Shewanella sp.]|uniref:bifunctional diguanylate cyclase/phosphodiesterase n=1 Tax=Shewanella sp. TaxID=50422 RepID=UPI00356827CB
MGRAAEDRGFEVVGYGSILAMVLEHRPLADVLYALTALIEAQTEGTVASILLLSEDGKRLLTGAAPNLPPDFNRMVHGVEIGKGVGSCGTAAFLGERVVVSDIASHEYWLPYNALPLAAGLKSCWSEPIKSVTGKVIGTFALYHDSVKSPTQTELNFISQAGKLAALAIERSRDQRYLKLVEHLFSKMPMAFAITDERDQIIYRNPCFRSWFGNFCRHLEQDLFVDTPLKLRESLHHRLASGESVSTEIQTRFNQEIKHLDVLVTPIADHQAEGNIYGWLMSDVSERKRAADLIRYQANFDALTGLANRFQLFERLEQACLSHEHFSLMLMDVDKFKQVNDSLGHDTGDALLESVARRLEALIPADALLARLGGDEFALYLPGRSEDVTHHLATELVAAMAEPFEVKGCLLYSGISLGMIAYPRDARQLEQLLCGADQAMYAAKAAGRNTWQDFTPRMQHEANREALLAAALKEAVSHQQLTLMFQPIVDANSHKIIAAEALLRWQFKGEAVSPMEFIPLAETSGLIVDIGRWVREQCMQLIKRLHSDGIDIQISVNVSSFELWSNTLQQSFLKEFSANHWADGDAASNCLILEITESLLMEQNEQLLATLSALRKKGVSIAIDDFGTGYSSLSYLANFPVDCIKLDKSFLDTLYSSDKGQALTKAIIQMGNALDLFIVAEGVETEKQLAFLTQQQVSKIQGYYFYRPMAEADLLALLQANK